MSKILVLPGTRWQIPLIQKAKRMGHNVFVVNPVKNDRIEQLADSFFASDIFLIDEIEKYAKTRGIEAIISDECDIAMPVVAELGERLKLPTISTATAALYTNKYMMREFARKIGIKNAEYQLCENAEDAVEFLKETGRSVIIKPIDCNASRGVFKVDSEQDIRNHFDEALFFSRIQKAVLAERYISGTEFTVDGIKTPDHHFTLAISEKKHYRHNENIAKELLFTHSNNQYDYERLKRVNDYFIMNSPLVFGLTHAEYKYENGEFYLIEIGARGGGNLISSVISQYMSGFDVYEYLINCSLGNIVTENFEIQKSYLHRTALLKFFDVPNGGGTVKDIIGIDFLKEEPDIVDFALNFSIGDEIKDAASDSNRIGYYIICSENKEKLEKVMNQVDKQFKILVE